MFLHSQKQEYITNFNTLSIKIHYVFVSTNVETSYLPTFKVGIYKNTLYILVLTNVKTQKSL